MQTVLYPLIAAILVIVFVGLFTMNSPEISEEFDIETVSASCLSEENDVDIRAQGNSIVITAPMKTPNPCYSAKGNVNFSENNIEVDLWAISDGGTCIQCVGEVVGRVTIHNLTEGVYGLEVKTADKAVITTINIG